MYARPINYNIQWGSTGTPIAPTVEKMTNGWSGSEKPLVQHMNWILNRIDGAIGYFLQGVSHWGSEVEYDEHDIVNYQGSLYRALQTHRNKPVNDAEYWESAFFSTLDGDNLKAIIDKIINEDGYLNKYMQISNPVTPNKVKAGSFQAKVGLASNGSPNHGYGFEGFNTTGMFLTNNNINFQVGGVIRGVIPNAVPLSDDDSNTLATTEWVQALIESKIGNIDMTANRLPVESLFFTIDDRNPNGILGYGTWVRFAEGQVVVGKSTQENDPLWTKSTLSETGEYTHQLSVAEMAKFRLTTNMRYQTNRWQYGSQKRADEGFIPNWGDEASSTYGGDQPHNNVQPSIVVNIWRRTA